MANRLMAKYKCGTKDWAGCKFIFELPVVEMIGRGVVCPRCNHLYLQWLNYETEIKNG